MITQLQQEKLDKAFQHLDVDGNGHAEYEDVIALATRILGAFEVSPSSPKGQRVISTFTEFWETLLATIDMDGDRRISPEEWRAGMGTAFVEDEATFERAFRPAIEAAVAVIDTSGDGVLQLDEFQTFQSAFGTSPEDVELAFHKLDVDGDGTLTVEELVEAGKQFYVGGRDDAPGNWLYGQI